LNTSGRMGGLTFVEGLALSVRSLTLAVRSLTLAVGTAFFGRLTEARRVSFVGFLDLLSALVPGRFDNLPVDLALGLMVRIFAAFLARAFPAGERLVAGLRRVDLPATTRLRDDAAADEWRGVERDASFFTLLAMGLLMRKALDSKTIYHKDRHKKTAELNIAASLIQRKNRVCGLERDPLFKHYSHRWPKENT
jgi:hypothetical protein